jgi:hypothetical protein
MIRVAQASSPVRLYKVPSSAPRSRRAVRRLTWEHKSRGPIKNESYYPE